MQVLETTTNISFKNILLLTDFTQASQAAVAYAVGLARHFKARLFPAHACDPVVLSETIDAAVLDKIAENSQQQLAGVIKEKDIVACPLFARATIEAVFPRWIEQNGIDLVVVGTHGRTGLQRLLIGSTAEFVFRNAPCPVLTVGPHVTARPYTDFKSENVLFPTDLGPHAESGASYALSFARDAHARLTFIHAVQPKSALSSDGNHLIASAREKLEGLVPYDAELWCEPRFIVKVGDPAQVVLDYSEQEHPDLIVLGLPHEKKYSNFRTGVTYKVITSAPCPVLTICDPATN